MASPYRKALSIEMLQSEVREIVSISLDDGCSQYNEADGTTS